MMLTQFFAGANMVAFLVAGLFFLRFWKKTHDRLFLIFAGAFAVMALERIALAWISSKSEITPFIYLIRLIAFVLIAVAIIDKNRAEKN